ncbi:hypothetical protein H4R35_003586 [Dimargaris xerosporica]|nr:hypothetical protein H4R35_003586 [Dimargaris xerosporica]
MHGSFPNSLAWHQFSIDTGPVVKRSRLAHKGYKGPIKSVKLTLPAARPKQTPSTDGISFDIAPLLDTAAESQRRILGQRAAGGALTASPALSHAKHPSGLTYDTFGPEVCATSDDNAVPLGSNDEPVDEKTEITLANVDHWAALVSEDGGDPETPVDLQTPEALPPSSEPKAQRSELGSAHQPLANLQQSSDKVRKAPTPEVADDKRHRLPVQRRQQQIQEEKRLADLRSREARRQAMQRQRDEERRMHEKQFQGVIGLMQQKKILAAFERELPRDREWDRLERERLRLIGVIFGIRFNTPRHPGSVPQTPIPPYSSMTSPLPDTPLTVGTPLSPYLGQSGGDGHPAASPPQPPQSPPAPSTMPAKNSTQAIPTVSHHSLLLGPIRGLAASVRPVPITATSHSAIVASEPIQEVEMDCDAEEGELSE